MSIAEERHAMEKRKQERWAKDMKEKTLTENIKFLKRKGYSDMAISKFLKINLSTVRLHTET